MPGGSLQYSYTIYFSSAMTGYVGGTNSRLFKTTDGGFNWVRDTANFLAFYSNFSFANDTVGWCVGGHGTVLHTTTGGGPFVGVEPLSELIPRKFRLFQNFPNPFNSSTKLKFQISESSEMVIKLFDMIGREIKILIAQRMSPGTYLLQLDANELASGTYFYCLIADGKLIETKKLILLK